METQNWVVVVVILIAFYFFSYNKPQVKQVDINKTEISESFKSGFMRGCIKDGDYDFCDCAYNSINNDLGYEGMVDLSAEYLKTETLPDRIIKLVVNECSSYMK